jgi:hypothetical protein
MGDVYNGHGQIIAGLRSENGEAIYGTIRSMKEMVYDNADDEVDDKFEDNIRRNDRPDPAARKRPEPQVKKNNEAVNIRMVDAPVSKPDPKKRKSSYSGVADALKSHYRKNSEIAVKEIEQRLRHYEESQKKTEMIRSSDSSTEDRYLNMVERPSKSAKKEATAPVQKRRTAPEPTGKPAPKPTGKPAPQQTRRPEPERRQKKQEPEVPAVISDEELGYDIPFNTTIGCIITNAKLTKSQANKLASILHDAYSRAIKPVHSTMDGDTIFVLSTCKQEVNFDAFAALATDVMQYAVIDAATSAKAAYGLPAYRDLF